MKKICFNFLLFSEKANHLSGKRNFYIVMILMVLKV